MGASTNAILRKGISILDIAEALSKKFDTSMDGVRIHETNNPDIFNIIIPFNYITRSIFVSFSNSCERDYGISGVFCSLGADDFAISILKYLCEYFGGYLNENDCESDVFYPYSSELYDQDKYFTELDNFKHLVISKVGHKNLSAVLSLCEKYCEIKEK